MSTAVILAWILLQFPRSAGFHTLIDDRRMSTGRRIVVDLPDPGVAAAAKKAAAYRGETIQGQFQSAVENSGRVCGSVQFRPQDRCPKR